MKKILIFAILIISLAGCKDDEYSFNNKIIGEWIQQKDSTEIYTYDDHLLVFNKDKTGELKYFGYKLYSGKKVDFSLKIKNVHFLSDSEIVISNQSFYQKDDSIIIDNSYTPEYIMYIKYMDSDSLVFTNRDVSHISIFNKKQ